MPLHLPAQNGHAEVVKFLAEQGADVKAKENDGWTLLHRTAGNGHVEVVKRRTVPKGAEQLREGLSA
jgi:ankyrin repeat domain-containing protein 50